MGITNSIANCKSCIGIYLKHNSGIGHHNEHENV